MSTAHALQQHTKISTMRSHNSQLVSKNHTKMKAISSIAALAMAFACVAAHELRGGSAVKLH